MDFEVTKAPSEGDVLGLGDVLVPEEDHLPFNQQHRQPFGQVFVRHHPQVNPVNHRSDHWGQMFQLETKWGIY